MKIALLISGGVDSSVALRLLKEQGHELTAFYLKIWLEDELKYLGDCPWEEDLKFARKVCKEAEVPLKIIPMQKEYWREIIACTIQEVKEGRTPNPDMLCNCRIKFGLFLDKIDKSFDKIASGHYAQVIEKNGKFLLKKSPDPVKDQTYFLSYLSQEQLKRVIFPVGHLTKSEVRKLACKYNLPNKDRHDSQGICFLGKFKYSEFLKHHLGVQKGDIVEFESGKKVGEHDGFWYYTIGQRKGIRLPGGPWYIVSKDPQKNIICVSKNYYEKDKKRDSFEVEKCNWFLNEKPKKHKLKAKIRHGENTYKCELKWLTKNRVHVRLDRPDQGIAPGQFAAFYDGDLCLGSGIISA